MTFLKLIRYPNLLMLVITLVLTKYVLLDSLYLLDTKLSNTHFLLFLISTISLAAGGYIINDIFDQKTDIINKPNKLFVGKSISIKNAWRYYIFLSVIGISSGLYICIKEASLFNGILCLATFLFLFLYSYRFKKIAIFGNLVISLLIPSSMLAVYIFEHDVTAFSESIHQFYIISLYLFFSGYTTFLRELVKDIEDVDGDYNTGAKTLPILIGKKRTRNIVLILTGILLLLVIMLANFIFQNHLGDIFLYGTIILVMIPQLYFFYHLWSAKTKKDFHLSSQYLKIIMVLGIFSMILFKI